MSNYYILTNLLSDDERRVITSIVRHIELGGNKVGIQQIASENYVSTAFIMKLCKRLGFAGYSELYYNLAQSSGEGHRSSDPDPLCGLIDGYTPEQAEQFCKMLMQYKERKIFVVGEGFAEEVANYIVKRLAICGFMVFNHVHFYDYMLFREEANRQITSNVESSLIIAISQNAMDFSPDRSTYLLVFVGLLTGVGGGVMRDVLAGNTPYILVKHVYACASLAGAVLCAVLWRLVPQYVAMLAGMTTVLLIRLLSAHFRWNLPRVKDETL